MNNNTNKPNIILLGKSNVGKSTLYNTIIGKKEAIVGEELGLTRDYQETICSIKDITFLITDTAGLRLSKDRYSKIQYNQILSRIDKADLLIFITDGSKNLTNEDRYCCEIVRKSGKKVLLIENKAELSKSIDFKNQTSEFGLGEPLRITAKNKACTELIYRRLIKIFLPNIIHNNKDLSENEIRIAIAGKPNTGKSTLLNLLYGSDRVITGSEAGTTRDSVITKIEYDFNTLSIIDTAGIKKRGKLNSDVDKASTYFSRKEIRYANIVFLVFDATLTISNQDLNIANYVIKEGRAILLVFNKWDLVKDKQNVKKNILKGIDKTFFDIKGVNLIFVSALQQKYKIQIFEKIFSIYQAWNKKIPTSVLNNWLQKEYEEISNHNYKGSLKLRYIKQIKIRPPTFTLFYNNKAKVTNSKKRYAINRLREKFTLFGIPIRVVLKSSKNPFKN